jgi:hypothetical protein
MLSKYPLNLIKRCGSIGGPEGPHEPGLPSGAPFGATSRSRAGGYVVRLVFRVEAGLSARPTPRTEGPRTRQATPLRSTAALARGGTDSRRPPPSFGSHPRGEFPGRFRGAWLRRSPPRPSTLLAPGPSRSFRPGCNITRKCECETLLTLTPTFPSRLDPCGPAWSSRTSSPGVVQRSPLHRSESWSPSPGPRVSALPFGGGQPALLAFRPRGFSPPRRFTPPRPCRFLSPCSRSWGSPCFPSSRNEVPHSAAPALRSLPSADSGEAGTCPSPRARVRGATLTVPGTVSGTVSGFDHSLHHAPCPLALLLQAARR